MIDIKREQQAADAAAAKASAAQQRADDARRKAFHAREANREAWAERATATFTDDLAQAQAAVRRAEGDFRSAVVERFNEAASAFLELAERRAQVYVLTTRLANALATLGRESWQGRAIPTPTIRDHDFGAEVSEVLRREASARLGEIEDAMSAEIVAAENGGPL